MPMLTVELTVLVAIAVIGSAVWFFLAKGHKAAEQEKEDVVIAAALSLPAIKEKSSEETIDVEDQPDDRAAAEKDNAVELNVEAIVTDKQDVPEEVPEVTVTEELILIEHRPVTLDAPDNDTPDALTSINGIGKAIQSNLYQIGIYHYSQIASWNREEAEWIENEIGFPLRVSREKWIEQAKARDAASAKPVSRKKSTASKSNAKPARKKVKTNKAPA